MPIDWSTLGLRHNPFENISPGEHLDWVDVAPELSAALSSRPFCIELVGEKGAGKSTTLRWFAARHEGARFIYVSDAGKLEPLPWEGTQVLCVDEVNNARPAAVHALIAEARRRNVSLLLSSHHEHEGPQVFELAKLHALGWVSRRVAAAALPGRTPFDFEAVARTLFPARTTVNYALLRVLYELAENLVRGAALPHALEDGVRRAREDETVAPLISAPSSARP